VEGSTRPIERGTWLALIAMGIAVFVIANDFSAINVAIPQIEEDFDTSVTTAQWVVNAYALTFGVLIVTEGGLADLFGRRRAFFVGAAIFATFSVLGGAAQSELADRDARPDGHRRRADVARDPRNDVRRPAGGAPAWPAVHPRCRRDRQCGRPPDRRRAHRPTELALDLLPQPTCVRLRDVRHLAEIHQPRPEVEDTRIDYGGIVTVSVGLVALLLAFDQAIDWGWGIRGSSRCSPHS
jgi:hypothetical protein